MAKQKSHRSARDRVKVTGGGKVMAFRAGKRHLNVGKSGSEIRGKGRGFVLAKTEWARLKKLVGEG
jgi:large subunit ribosomal protein L35